MCRVSLYRIPTCQRAEQAHVVVSFHCMAMLIGQCPLYQSELVVANVIFLRQIPDRPCSYHKFAWQLFHLIHFSSLVASLNISRYVFILLSQILVAPDDDMIEAL